MQSVKVGSRTLISHQYSDNANRYLTKSTYGNNDYISYAYDNLGRTTSKTYEDGDTVSYAYDIRGNLGTVTDSATGHTTKYSYDFQDRLSRYEETGSGYSNVVTWSYDTKNNLTSQTQVLNGTTYTTNYSYNSDTNRLTSSAQGSVLTEYGYDGLGRMTGITEKNSGSQVVHTTIGYTNKNGNANITSSQVSTWNNTVGGAYTYTYDDRGNITSIKEGNTTLVDYAYDTLDQLTVEKNYLVNKRWEYTYDDGGNITSKTEFLSVTADSGTTIYYNHTNTAWRDLLTSYGNHPLTDEGNTPLRYDEVGNLTSDGTWEYTWEHGRQLADMSKSGTNISYAYNADGMRISKNVNGTVYNYHYLGDQLTEMTWGSNKMAFVYDVIGPAALIYNGTTYYYVRNAQGDVTGIVNASGTQVVAYTYDAWGKLLSTTGSMATTLGVTNPLRYRGYVYDQETGLYYLQSRYYNPSWGRFINADVYVQTGYSLIGNNMYAYSNNNPVCYYDPDGTCSRVWGFLWKKDCGVKSCPTSKTYAPNPSEFEFFLTDMTRPREYGLTFSASIGASNSIGGVLAGESIALAVDTSYNYEIQTTTTTGASTGFGASGGVSITITNANNVQDLTGLSEQLGATGVFGAGLAIDIIRFTPASNPNKTCYGLSLSLLAGAEMEFHSAVNATTTRAAWNPFLWARRKIYGY